MQLLGSKRLKDGRTVLPAGKYSKPTENQAIMNMETGEIITPSLKDQRIAKMIEDNKKLQKENAEAAKPKPSGYSGLKTKAEFDSYIASSMTKPEFNKLKTKILDSRKEENNAIIRAQDKLVKKAQSELAKEGIETFKGDQYSTQGFVYVKVAPNVYANRSAKSKSGKSVYDYADKYRKEQNKLDKRAKKLDESLTPFEAYITRPGITYDFVTGK